MKLLKFNGCSEVSLLYNLIINVKMKAQKRDLFTSLN